MFVVLTAESKLSLLFCIDLNIFNQLLISLVNSETELSGKFIVKINKQLIEDNIEIIFFL